jgi:hypothetical protein
MEQPLLPSSLVRRCSRFRPFRAQRLGFAQEGLILSFCRGLQSKNTQGTKLRKLESGVFSRPSKVPNPGYLHVPLFVLGFSVCTLLDLATFCFGKENVEVFFLHIYNQPNIFTMLLPLQGAKIVLSPELLQKSARKGQPRVATLVVNKRLIG